jgi:hypothetical protein
LARFARARKMVSSEHSILSSFVSNLDQDLEKTWTMLDTCLTWRMENRVDTILDWWPKECASAERILQCELLLFVMLIEN